MNLALQAYFMIGLHLSKLQCIPTSLINCLNSQILYLYGKKEHYTTILLFRVYKSDFLLSLHSQSLTTCKKKSTGNVSTFD